MVHRNGVLCHKNIQQKSQIYSPSMLDSSRAFLPKWVTPLAGKVCVIFTQSSGVPILGVVTRSGHAESRSSLCAALPTVWARLT